MKTFRHLMVLAVLCGLAFHSQAQVCAVPGSTALTVTGNQYAFQWRASAVSPLTNIGLAFNSADNEYQFRRVDATKSILAINPTAGAYVRAGDPCAGDYAQFDAGGHLRFFGGADYQVENNRYAFRSRADEDNGLFFNVALNQYEFRSNSAAATFNIKANTTGGDVSGSFSTTGDGDIDGRLTVGALAGDDNNGINAQNYFSGRAAVRGQESSGAFTYSEGYLGVLSPTVAPISVPFSVTNVGVLGIKRPNGSNGAAVYGWNNDVNATNYGGIFIADGAGTNNQAVYASASGGATTNLALLAESSFSNSASRIGIAEFKAGSSSVGIDNNEMQSYISGAAGGTLYLQFYGGNLDLLNTFGGDGDLTVHSGLIHADGLANRVGINTFSPTSLFQVNGNSTLTEGIIEGTVNYSGSSDIRALRGTSNPNASGGWGYGAQGNGGYRGVYGSGDGLSYGGGVMGVQGSASATAGGGTRYGVYGSAFGGTTNYAVYASGDLAYTGSLLAISDAQFKDNVENIADAAEIISKLQPRVYDLKMQEYDYLNFQTEQQYGFIAQEMEEVLPLLVADMVHPGPVGEDGRQDNEIKFKGVNYIGMIPVIVAAMQEQQEEIEAKDEAIDDLKEMVEELAEKVRQLDNSLAACCISHDADMHAPSSGADNAKLGQNIPNPFTGSTLISYYLPETAANAVIRVVDLNGSLVSEFQLNNPGFGQVEFKTSDYAAGMYIYSLLIDGMKVDSRQMQLMK